MTKREFEIKKEFLNAKIRAGESYLDKLYCTTCSELSLARAQNSVDDLYLQYKELLEKRLGEVMNDDAPKE